MTSDYQMVTTVKREFARRLPTELVTLVLEFANWVNIERKRVCLQECLKFAKTLSYARSHHSEITKKIQWVRCFIWVHQI